MLNGVFTTLCMLTHYFNTVEQGNLVAICISVSRPFAAAGVQLGAYGGEIELATLVNCHRMNRQLTRLVNELRACPGG
jgi:hypothetical protein